MSLPETSYSTVKFATEDLGFTFTPGSESWWRSIKKSGTPLQRKMATGDVEITFLWRDPDGALSDYARVYLDVYSHTPHPTLEQTTMVRLENTDVWFWQTRLPADWCGSYFLMPAKHQQLPPNNADKNQLRRWWIQLMRTNAQADVLNLQPAHSSGWGLPLSAIQLAHTDFFWISENKKFVGNLQCTSWRSQRLNNERDIWLYDTGAHQNSPLVLLLDGHYWATQMPIFTSIDALTVQGKLPPARYLLIDALDPDARAHEMPCNENFWLAIQQELLPTLQLADVPAQRTLIAGQSFGGLSAVYAALMFPDKFGLVLSQSGSFWWPDANETGNKGSLVQQVAAGLGKDFPVNILLEVGCYETDMLGVNKAMYEALRNNNIGVDLHEFRGGHDWICWREGLLRGLCCLLQDV